jgi:hypothetical protein
MNKKRNSEAAETVQTTSVPAVDLPRLVRRCVTHHFACDCREALMAESMQTQRRVIDWHSQSDEGLRLRCGELTAQEIRTIRALLNAILPPNVRDDRQLPGHTAKPRNQTPTG